MGLGMVDFSLVLNVFVKFWAKTPPAPKKWMLYRPVLEVGEEVGISGVETAADAFFVKCPADSYIGKVLKT